MKINNKIKSILKFTNLLVKKGKKSRAILILLKTLFLIKKKTKKNPINYLHSAIKVLTPGVSTRKTIVAGRLYHLPSAISTNKSLYFGCNWLQQSAINSKENNKNLSLSNKIYLECLKVLRKKGNAILFLKQHNKVVSDNRPFLRFVKKKRNLRLPRKVYLRKRRILYLKRRKKLKIPSKLEDSFNYKLNSRLKYVKNQLYDTKIETKFQNKTDRKFSKVDKKQLLELKIKASLNPNNVKSKKRKYKLKNKKINKKNKF